MSNIFEHKYKVLLMETLLNGDLCSNRTGIKTYKKFNQTLNINLGLGFPIVTGKKIFFNKALAEFNWLYQGKTDLNFLHKNGIKWWDDFAINGKLGKVYGYQIRHFNGAFDQVKYVIEEIKNNSRRAVVSLWNPTDLAEQALPCCYTQLCFVRSNNKLNMVMNFRSSDLFLGLPYDIIVGALFLISIAKECNLIPGTLGINLADAHIYESHKKQVIDYYHKPVYILPKINDKFELENYICGDFIKADLVK